MTPQLAEEDEGPVHDAADAFAVMNRIIERDTLPSESVAVRDARLIWTRHAKAVIFANMKIAFWKERLRESEQAKEAADTAWCSDVGDYHTKMARLDAAEREAAVAADDLAVIIIDQLAHDAWERTEQLGYRARHYLATHVSIWGWLTATELSGILGIIGDDDMEDFRDQLMEMGIDDSHVSYLISCIEEDRRESAPSPLPLAATVS